MDIFNLLLWVSGWVRVRVMKRVGMKVSRKTVNKAKDGFMLLSGILKKYVAKPCGTKLKQKVSMSVRSLGHRPSCKIH